MWTMPSWIPVATFASVALYVVVATALGGRTLGKALLGLRVVATDGSPAGWRRSLVRAAIALGPWWVGLLPIDWTWVVSYAWLLALAATTAIDPERRGFHDRAAGTVVART